MHIEWFQPVFFKSNFHQYGIGKVKEGEWVIVERSAAEKLQIGEEKMDYDAAVKCANGLTNKVSGCKLSSTAKEVIAMGNPLKLKESGDCDYCIQAHIDGDEMLVWIDKGTEYVQFYSFRFKQLQKMNDSIRESAAKVLGKSEDAFLFGHFDGAIFWIYNVHRMPCQKYNRLSFRLEDISQQIGKNNTTTGISMAPFQFAHSIAELKEHETIFVKCCGFQKVYIRKF